ncbi:alcohol dehydrogenase (quinone), cytochrome c subunit [Brucella sp. NBRC 12953]|uniref:c-type cytochrome n=1 Tax=Brucella sp. NBRC 12953 TaxID=3075481 RepID=UPI0030963606
MRRLFVGAVGLALVCGLIAASVPFWPVRQPYDQKAAEQRFANQASKLVERGRYLAVMADCAACHQSPDGAPFAGGLGLATPFGTIYGSNITPDKQAGIGNYSSSDFYHALTDGIRPDGAFLYPAMPFISYHDMSQADSDAIFAYLNTQQPVARKTPRNTLPFPFNQRWTLAYWRLVNPPIRLKGDPTALAGAYIADVLGHCQECHTPRNFMGGLVQSRAYQGASLGSITAPSLTPEALADRGWTSRDIQSFLKTGMAPQGTMTLEMYPVLMHSSQYMQDADIAALEAYLTKGRLPQTSTRTGGELQRQAGTQSAGRDVYVSVCAGCHGLNGEGKPHIAPAMNINTSAMLADPSNLIQVILNGVAEQKLANNEVMQAMPGFRTALSAQQVADLVNYMRNQWGDQPADIQSADIERAEQ